MKRPLSIRTYLLVLALGIMLPFLALHLYFVYRQAAQEAKNAEKMVVSLAHIAAGDTEHFLSDSKMVLQRLAERPEIRSLDTAQCETFLRLFPCVNPNFCSIGVVTSSGRQVCTVAEAHLQPVDVLQDQDWLRNAIEVNGFAMGRPFIDADRSRYVIVLGHSIRGAGLEPIGAVAIAVDLLTYDSVHYKTALGNARLPPGSTVTIVDSNGFVIARWPNAEQWVGTNAREAPIVQRLLSEAGTSAIQTRGMDGFEKLYGAAPIRDTTWYLYAGIPVDVLFTPSHELLYRNLALGATALILAMALALYLSGLIRNPIRRLSEIAIASAEERAEFSPPDVGPLEVIEVGQCFKMMLLSREKAVEALAEEKERAEVTLASIGDAVITTDAGGKVTYLNPVAEQLTGWNLSQAHGLPLFNVANFIDTATGQPLQKTLQEAIEEGYLVNVNDNAVLVNRHGQEYAVADCAAPIRDRQGELVGTVLVFRDITKAKELARKLSWQATHDVLTGLYNRTDFERRLAEAIMSAKDDGLQHAMLYFDLDQFKIVNDTCGHAAGDELLRHLTVLLQEEVRGVDILARLGGDEFGVLLENCPLDQAMRIAEEFRETVQGFRFAWNGKTFIVGVSIGVVPITAQTEDVAKVMNSADTACYAAKEKGRNCVLVFQPDNLEMAQHAGAMQWVQRISDAFEEDRFLLYCQTILPLDETADSPRFQEILIRMQDESGELLLPGAFLTAAERYNLMPTIDRWVVRTLFARLSEHKGTLDARAVYFVNVSGPTLSDEHFLDFVIDQFVQAPVSPEGICFEITESAAILNLPQATRFITVLRNMGCRFALDDFGTGISSFGYLKNLAVDYLKIAGAFVLNMESEGPDYAMVESINHIGHVMNLNTIGEWAESGAVIERLRTLGVDYAQGFGISSPIPLAEMLAATTRKPDGKANNRP